ncbi:MAG TPA: cytochrome c, partial [Bacteroidota bacterium]|nr:cytochrome c [Bacteroidota bacterium]
MSETKEQLPVEVRSYGRYYLIFSIVLITATLWAVIDEVRVRRPWKEYQAEYYTLAAAKADSLEEVARAGIDSVQAATLKQALDSAQAGMESKEYTDAADQKETLLKQLDVSTTGWRNSRSRSDAAYYQYQRAKLEEGKDDPSLRKEVTDDDSTAAKYFAAMGVMNAKIAALDETINHYKDAFRKAQKEYQDYFVPVTAQEGKADKLRGSPLAIRQVVLEDFEFTPFQEIKARVDRCQTCHLGWKDSTMVDAPQPFTTHPFPELLKMHNPETFGCTPCHRGQGPALSAGFAHGDEDENWQTPILHGDDIYATCNSCHASESILKDAKPFTRAKQLVAESGCFGCHDINGFADLTRIGPSLNSLPSKVKPGWIYDWVKNPKEYNPHTRMPNFKLTGDQAEAVTAYLEKIGDESAFKPVSPHGSYAGGNAAEGKNVFETVGCQ